MGTNISKDFICKWDSLCPKVIKLGEQSGNNKIDEELSSFSVDMVTGKITIRIIGLLSASQRKELHVCN